MEAGSIMHARLRELAARRRDFAFETTLASRSLAPWLAELVRGGYEFHLVFLWLPSEDFAVQRVADRVRMGGHSVPEATVRRRYERGLRNFFRLYQPLAATWGMPQRADYPDLARRDRGRWRRQEMMRRPQSEPRSSQPFECLKRR
ncbi:MAG: hypothetical protein NTY19_51290 [Planctomycetota bacterium]|nr:hypothetical protein [Planctomycetota bacterium]